LSPDEVHVWPIKLEASAAQFSSLSRLLSEDEKRRAESFKFERHSRAFVISRGFLRLILADYLRQSPESIAFTYGLKGKPGLTPSSIKFNLSHSEDMALLALTSGVEIGVDLEKIRPMNDLDNIARRFFSEQECHDLMNLTPSSRNHAFFNCWTRKEAFLKATGDGLSAPLDQFQVTLLPNQEARLVHVCQNVDEARTWTIHDLSLLPGFAAAIAYRAPVKKLQIREVRED